MSNVSRQTKGQAKHEWSCGRICSRKVGPSFVNEMIHHLAIALAARGIRRVAVLWNPTNRVLQTQAPLKTEAAAGTLGIQLKMFEAHDLPSIERAFETISKDRPAGLSLLADPTLNAYAPRIAALAQRAGLPSVSGVSLYAEADGLMANGPDFYELYRNAAGHVAKILRGARPAELPIEQPTKFELVINMKTATQLGVSLPQSLLLRADRVIE